MSKTLYFAKINVNSESTYKSYRGECDLKLIMNQLSEKIKDNIKYTNTISKIVDGNKNIIQEEIQFTGIKKFSIDSEKIIVGGVVKSSKVFINNVNKSTGEKVTKAVDSDEIVNFCFYPNKEIVSFYCANRFGHQTFKDVFQGLINNAYQEENFKVSILTNGVSLDNIKESLKKIKNIEELRIDIIPPNPDDELRKSLERDVEKKLKSFEMGRVNEKSILFKSNYADGLNTESKEIDKELIEVTAIHTKLSIENSTKNGYVRVEAKDRSGVIYNTDTNKVVKHKMKDSNADEGNKFASFCKSAISMIFK